MNYTAGIVKKDKKFTKTSKDKDFANDLVEVKIVIPEKNNVFEDKEEVLLVPSETKDDVKDYFYVLTSLEMYNYINNELNEELKSDINKKESIIIDNEKKINDLTNKIAINDSIIEDNEKEIHDLKSKIAIFKKEIKDNKIDISDLKDKIDIKDSLIITSNNEIDDLKGKLDIKDSLIITSNNEIDDLKGKLDIKDSIIESNKKKIEDLSSKIAIKTENSDKKMSKEASDYQHDYEVHKINKKQINKDSTTYKSNNFSKKQPQYSDIIQIARLEEDKKFLKEELINLRAILKDTQINENKKFSDLQNKYEDLLTKFNSIQEELNEVKNNESFYEDINKKLKNFILNSF